MVHKQFHMVSGVRRAALTAVIALLPSFLDIVSTLLSPFPGRGTLRLCLRIFPSVMPPELLYTFVYDYAIHLRGKSDEEKEGTITITASRKVCFRGGST